MRQLSQTPAATAGTSFSEAFGAAQDAARPERLPWGSAALVIGGFCLLLWAAVITAVVALL